MKNIKLLDCTLRDGGFINNWNFGEDGIVNIIERLDEANVDIIEIGYLREYVDYEINETQFPHTKYIGNIMPKQFSMRPMVVAIIDYGNFGLDKILPCKEVPIDGIRITFKKNQIDEALDFCKKIEKLGYKIFAQPVSFMDYSQREILDLIDKINELQPFAVSIVDTYGFMNQKDLIHRVNLIDDTLNEDIYLGYHSHNNFQLAYSNAIAMLELQTNRNMIIDTSILGMGKGAGNTNTELLALYLNEYWDKNYDIDQLMEIADIYIEKEKSKNYWGYSLKYYIAAMKQCHHKYVDYLLKKKTLSIHSVNEILSMINKEKVTSFDENHIVELYNAYQVRSTGNMQDYNRLNQTFAYREILIIAPGKNITKQKDKIQSYIQKNDPFIISVNFIPDTFKVDYVFVSNAKRYSQIALKIQRCEMPICLIATSNINTTAIKANFVLNYADLALDDEELISDNSTLLLLKALIKCNVKKVSLAGFDGFDPFMDNYVRDDLDFMNTEDLIKKNALIAKALEKIKTVLNITFITESKYNEDLMNEKL